MNCLNSLLVEGETKAGVGVKAYNAANIKV